MSEAYSGMDTPEEQISAVLALEARIDAQHPRDTQEMNVCGPNGFLKIIFPFESFGGSFLHEECSGKSFHNGNKSP